MNNFFICECGFISRRGAHCYWCGTEEEWSNGLMDIRERTRESQKTATPAGETKPKGKPGRPKAVFVQGKPWKQRVKEYKNARKQQ